MTGKTVTVTTAAQLLTAARAAKSGDTILLAPGNYGAVGLSQVNPTGTITIKSADPNHEAVFTTLNMTRVSNIVLQDVEVSRTLAAGADPNKAGAAVQVNGGTNVTFSHIFLHGTLDGSALDDGMGMSISAGSHVSILNSTFQQLRTAVIVRGDNFLFAGNTVTEVQEGLSISSMHGGVFEQNYMTNWQGVYSSTHHPDMFQVHSGGTATASSNLIFRDNVMTPNTDQTTGGIFIRSEGVGRGERHDNILIENNYYEGTARNAISVGNSDNVTVRDNTVLMGDNKGMVPAINLADIRGGLVEDNVSTLLLENRNLKNSGLAIKNNIDVWDSQFKKGIAVSQLFSGNDPTPGDFSNLNVLADSAAGKAGAGFKAVADIGHLSGSAAAQMAAFLPTYEQQFAVFH